MDISGRRRDLAPVDHPEETPALSPRALEGACGKRGSRGSLPVLQASQPHLVLTAAALYQLNIAGLPIMKLCSMQKSPPSQE